MGRIDNRLVKTKYKWGNVRKIMREYDKRAKETEHTAQKIRDYFNTPEWDKVKKKNGYF